MGQLMESTEALLGRMQIYDADYAEEMEHRVHDVLVRHDAAPWLPCLYLFYFWMFDTFILFNNGIVQTLIRNVMCGRNRMYALTYYVMYLDLLRKYPYNYLSRNP